MKHVFAIILVVASCQVARAQYFWDFGASVGFGNYLGEIGGSDGNARDFVYDMKLNQTRWSIGGFARYRLSHNFAINFGVNWIRLQGADSLSEGGTRFGRNLSFRNDLIETYVRGEYYFYQINDVGRTGRYRLDFKAYVFAGLAMFYNNPKGNLDGVWHALQPLNTEGPDNRYSKFQPAIPLGIGFYYTFKRQHRFGWQIGWRMTFTDYIDDVSTTYPDPDELSSATAVALSNRSAELVGDPRFIGLSRYVPGSIRGNPNGNDSYLAMSFTYSKVIRGKGKSFLKKKYNYLYGRRRKGRTRAKF